VRSSRRIGPSGGPTLTESPIRGSYFRPIPDAAASRTIKVMRDLFRSISAEKAVPDPPQRVWRDWALVGAALVAGVFEAIFRSDLPWRWPSIVVGLVVIPTLLWRRTHPLATVIVAFGAVTFLDVGRLIAGVDEPAGLHSSAVLIILPYALTRWGSGRHVLIAMPFMLVPAVMSVIFDFTGVAEAVVGSAMFFAILAVGMAVRFRTGSRAREVEQIKLLEREHLARELHDTVAHHVSAMAIQAQAGIAAAAAHPSAAIDALQVIETEASRTLSEMRTMVRMLRRDDPAERAPTPGISEISQFVRSSAPGPPVDVTIDGDFADIPSAVSAATYRLAQEAVTNALRHARRATRIEVAVCADPDAIRLRVHDDGASSTPGPQGYGLVGMAERAALVGGTCDAGPDSVTGWTVTAVLPRNGTRTA
jgi:signal transduction histidine kinase